jgi:putative LysE/RhtB family amino acid efflux pump
VHAMTIGFGLGFLVALQLGPMSLLLIRSTLRAGWSVGLAIGAGIAVVDGLYAAMGTAGVAPLLSVESVRIILGMVGAAVLIALGLRSLWSAFRIRSGGETAAEISSPSRAFATAVVGTASNPSTILSWAAIFAAARTAGVAGTTAGAVLLVVGVALGSLTWVSLLASATAATRRAVGQRALRIAEGIAGMGLIGYGGALGYSTAEHR